MIKFEEVTQLKTKTLEELNKLLVQVSATAKPMTSALLLQIIHDENVTLLAAKEGGVIIGMGILIILRTAEGLKGYVDDVVIDEPYRGQGIGKKLMEEIIKIAREKKLMKIELTSRSERVAANKLYQKLGFEIRETNVYRLKL